MKNSIIGQFIAISILVIIGFVGCKSDKKSGDLEDILRNGDIIFQSSKSGQSHAVQLATKSKYSHVGIVYFDGDEVLVYEAVQPVKLTPLKEWIRRGDDNHYVVKRLKNSEDVLTATAMAKMMEVGKRYEGKPYDIYFGWSDERLYCSELVWKIYKEGAGVEVGEIQKLSEFDLSSDIVKEIMDERYGDNIPYNEKVVSPASIFESDLLKTVAEN